MPFSSGRPRCRSCGEDAEILLDGGALPFSARYLSAPEETPAVWPKKFGCCPNCGLAQLIEPAPLEFRPPRLAGAAFNEPEEHISRLAAEIRALTGPVTVGGLSSKDDVLLKALGDLGMRRRPPRPASEGSAASGRGELVDLQTRLLEEPGFLRNPARPPVQLLSARHILEHILDLPKFLAAVSRLVSPDGWLFVEVPACENELRDRDYARLWEDHTQYFTDVSLSNLLSACGFYPFWRTQYQTAQENLHCVLSRKGGPASRLPIFEAGEAFSLARDFAGGFTACRQAVQKVLARFKGRAALMGAGHLGLSFIHLMGLSGLIDYIYDDHPNKQGLYAAGLRPAVRPSAELEAGGSRLCLLAFNPALEGRAAKRHGGYLEKGGLFASVFPNSPNYILKLFPEV